MLGIHNEKEMIQYSVATDKGTFRTINQDNVFFMHSARTYEALEHFRAQGSLTYPALFAVCDGMGGGMDGEKASFEAVCSLGDFPLKKVSHMKNRRLENCFVELFLSVNEKLFQKYGSQGISGSTMTMLYADAARIYVFNAGDSPCFGKMAGKSEWRLLTQADNRANHLYQLGLIQGEERWTHKASHQLTQYLGMNPDEIQIVPHMYGCKRGAEASTYLIGSDGLFEKGNCERMLKAIEDNGVFDGAKACVEIAMEAGCRDNVTAIVVQVGGRHDKRGIKRI